MHWFFCLTEDGTLFTASQGRSIIYSKRFKQPQLTNVFTSRKKGAFYDGESNQFLGSFPVNENYAVKLKVVLR